MTYIYYFITSLLIAVSSYLASDSFIFAGIVFVIFVLFFFLYVNRRYIKTSTRIKCFNECYEFISNFIITLSVHLNVSSAYEYTLIKESIEFKSIKENTKNLPILERLDYFKKYFSFDIYSLFVNVVMFYNEQGGNVIELSNTLLNENRAEEEYVIKTTRYIKNKIIEFTILWLLTLAILIVLRFSLSQFYKKLSSHMYLYIGLAIFYLFLLFSIFLLTYKSSSFDIKGWNNNESN